MRIKETVIVERIIYSVLAGLLAYVILSPVYNSVSGAISNLTVLVGV